MPKGRESEYFNWPTTDARKTSSKSSMQEGGGILDRFRKNIKDRVKKGKEEFAKEAAKQKAERKSRTIKAEAREGERKATIKAKKEARKKGVEYKKPEGGKDYRKIMKENQTMKYGPEAVLREDLADLNRYTMVVEDKYYRENRVSKE